MCVPIVRDFRVSKGTSVTCRVGGERLAERLTPGLRGHAGSAGTHGRKRFRSGWQQAPGFAHEPLLDKQNAGHAGACFIHRATCF
jgi:hypothetical protein